MKTRFALLLTLATAGCAGLSHEPPVSLAQSASGGPPNQQPQSPNSLPLGSQVEAPFVSATGIVSTTRVGPAGTTAATPVTSVQPPLVSPGTATAGTGTRRAAPSF